MSAPTVEHSAAKGGQGGGDGTNPWVLPNVQVTSANKLLIFVAIARLSKTVTTVTRNGQSATLVTGSTANADNGSIRVNGAWYYIDNPSVGTYDVSVAYTGTDTAGWVISAQSLVGAASGQPHAVAQNAAVSSTPVAPTITTSVVDTLVLSGFMVGRSDTVTGVAADSPATTLSSPITTDTSATHAQKGKIASTPAATAAGYTVTHTLTGTPNRTAQSLVAIEGSVSGVNVSGSGALSLGGSGAVNVGVKFTGGGALALAASGLVKIGLAIAGSAALVLGASGQVTTPVAVQGSGALSLGGSGAVQVAVALAGGAELSLGGSGTVAVAVGLSGGGAIVLGASGAIAVPVSVSGGGALDLGASGTLEVPVAVAGGGALTLGGSGEFVIGSLPVTVGGGGALTLGGSGAVRVEVRLSGSGALVLGATGAVRTGLGVGGGAQLVLGGSGQVRVGVRLQGGGALGAFGASGTIVVSATSLTIVFPNIRQLEVLGDPLQLAVLGEPLQLAILDEEGNVGRYALKVGSTRPKLRLQCQDGDGNPFSLVGVNVSDLIVGLRRSGEDDYALLLTSPAADIENAAQGIVAIDWAPTDAEVLGPGEIDAEVRVLDLDGEPTRFPVEGWATFVVWEAIVPEPGS